MSGWLKGNVYFKIILLLAIAGIIGLVFYIQMAEAPLEPTYEVQQSSGLTIALFTMGDV